MSRLSASLVVDLVDKTGAKTRTIIGNMDRLKRAERDYMLADKGLRLSSRDRAMERLMNERVVADEERIRRMNVLATRIGTGIAVGGIAAAKAYQNYAELERRVNRIVINADKGANTIQPTILRMQEIAAATKMGFGDIVEGLEALVASGRSLDESLAFLPSIALTAQASGAAMNDVALSADALSGSLKINAGEMQRAFDILVAGGKAGKFELRDMAQYLPSLLPAFSAMGYEGTDGLRKIVAMLQVMRNQAGSSSEAATYLGNVLNKVYSEETASKFKKMGVDLPAALEKAEKEGRDVLDVFLDMTMIATKGDLSKLPKLFTDAEFQKGMRALITQRPELEALFKSFASVDGTAMNDFKQIIGDSAANLQELSNLWDKFVKQVGAGVATVANPVLDRLTNDIDFNSAAQRGMEKEGWGWLRRQLGFTTEAQSMELAYKGGYRDPEFLKDYWVRHYGSGAAKSSNGRQNQPIVRKEFPGGGHDYTTKSLPESSAPLPSARPGPGNPRPKISDIQSQYMAYGKGRAAAEAQTAPIANMNVFDAYETKLTAALAQGGDKIAEGGDKAAQTMKASADQIGVAIAQSFVSRVRSSLASLLPSSGAERSTGQVAKEQLNGQFVDP